jgi:hypothetical protein
VTPLLTLEGSQAVKDALLRKAFIESKFYLTCNLQMQKAKGPGKMTFVIPRLPGPWTAVWTWD